MVLPSLNLNLPIDDPGRCLQLGMETALQLRSDWTKDQLKSEVDFKKEVEDLKRQILPLKVKVVFCHNDLLLSNILFDVETEAVNFIDYEYASPNYDLFDLGNHFNEWAGVEDVDYSRCPKREEKRRWLTNYYRHRERKAGVDELVDFALRHIALFEAASHLFWSIWCLVQAQNSTIDFNYLEYASCRLHGYYNRLRKYKTLLLY